MRLVFYTVCLSLFLQWVPAHGQLPAADADPESATAVTTATVVTSATRPARLLDGIDRETESLVRGASAAIQAAIESVVGAAGGERSASGRLVARILSVAMWELVGRPVWLYLLSLLVILLGLTLRHFAVRRLIAVAQHWTRRTRTDLDDRLVESLAGPLRLLVLLVALYVGLRIVMVTWTPAEVSESGANATQLVWNLVRTGIYLAGLYALAWALVRVADIGVDAAGAFYRREGTELDETFMPLIRRTVKIFICGIVVLQALDFLQFDTVVNSLLAAAGVSGLAIGLAAQDTLKNFFGSVVLLADRPFSVGDWIVAGETEGVVEFVGIRSTRIRTFAKTLVTVPNSSIVDRDINNFSRMPIRRVKMTIGVTYSATADQMETLVARLREMLRNDPEIWQDLLLVRFTDFGASSLDVFVYYFSRSTVWDEHLAVRERVNLQIMRLLDEMGLEIAFPTRTIHMVREEHEPPLPRQA